MISDTTSFVGCQAHMRGRWERTGPATRRCGPVRLASKVDCSAITKLREPSFVKSLTEVYTDNDAEMRCEPFMDRYMIDQIDYALNLKYRQLTIHYVRILRDPLVVSMMLHKMRHNPYIAITM